VLHRLHESSPDEPDVTANLARLGLNIDQDTSQAQKLAREAYDRAPGDVNCAVTNAFSLYGLNRSAEALEIVKKLPADQLYDPHAAVYLALLLVDQSQAQDARAYIKAAEGGPLYLEEKKLLSEIKLRLPPASSSPSPSASPTPTLPPTPTPSSPPE
jgi:hypothetical protein